MRSGYLVAGIGVAAAGALLLLAVGYAVADCPANYVCSANPIGIAVGAVLLAVGTFLGILAFVLPPRATTRPVDPSRTGLASIPDRACPRCGTANPVSSRFCARCGSALPPTSGP